MYENLLKCVDRSSRQKLNKNEFQIFLEGDSPLSLLFSLKLSKTGTATYIITFICTVPKTTGPAA